MSNFKQGRFKGRGGGRPTPYNREDGGPTPRRMQRNKGNNNRAGAAAVVGVSGGVNEVGTTPLLPKSNDNTNTDPTHQQEGAGVEQSSGTPVNTKQQEPVQPSPHLTPTAKGHAEANTPKEKKYSVRARLFVGNLPKDTKQEQVRELFEEFGEVKEVFVQKEKSFGFIRMVSGVPCSNNCTDICTH